MWQILPDLFQPGTVVPPALADQAGAWTLRAVTAHTDKYRSVVDEVTDDRAVVEGDLASAARRASTVTLAAHILARGRLWLRACQGSLDIDIAAADRLAAFDVTERPAVDALCDAPHWREQLLDVCRSAMQRWGEGVLVEQLSPRPARSGLNGYPAGDPLHAASVMRLTAAALAAAVELA